MSSEPRRIIIAGAGRFGRDLRNWLTVYGGYEFVGFIDDISSAPEVLGRIVDHSPLADTEYLVSIGDSAGRLKVGRLLEARGARLAIVCSPYALLAPDFKPQPGFLIIGASDVSSNVTLGKLIHVQGFCAVAHDVTLGDGVTVSSHSFIGGGALIGEGATLFPHSVILPDIRVGEGAVVGAGAVVTKDVAPHTTVFGNPARLIATHKPA